MDGPFPHLHCVVGDDGRACYKRISRTSFYAHALRQSVHSLTLNDIRKPPTIGTPLSAHINLLAVIYPIHPIVISIVPPVVNVQHCYLSHSLSRDPFSIAECAKEGTKKVLIVFAAYADCDAKRNRLGAPKTQQCGRRSQCVAKCPVYNFSGVFFYFIQ